MPAKNNKTKTNFSVNLIETPTCKIFNIVITARDQNKLVKNIVTII